MYGRTPVQEGEFLCIALRWRVFALPSPASAGHCRPNYRRPERGRDSSQPRKKKQRPIGLMDLDLAGSLYRVVHARTYGVRTVHVHGTSARVPAWTWWNTVVGPACQTATGMKWSRGALTPRIGYVWCGWTYGQYLIACLRRCSVQSQGLSSLRTQADISADGQGSLNRALAACRWIRESTTLWRSDNSQSGFD